MLCWCLGWRGDAGWGWLTGWTGNYLAPTSLYPWWPAWWWCLYVWYMWYRRSLYHIMWYIITRYAAISDHVLTLYEVQPHPSYTLSLLSPLPQPSEQHQDINIRYTRSSCRYNERQLIDVTVVRRVRPRAERRYHAYHPLTNKQIAIQLFLGRNVGIMRTTTH